jgi:peptide/nickel transport system substrate-binding protein/oligopeptide transport system substrate-binding protein
MGYRNSGVDEKLEQARRETDYLRRMELYREIEKSVMAEAPIICQHINTFNCLLQPWVQGVSMNVLGPTYVSLRNVRIDPEVFERVASVR